MAGIIPGPLITGPEPVGRRYGLLSAAAGPIDLPPHGQGGGVRYAPVTCGDAVLYPIDCSDGLVDPPTKTPDPNDATIEALPFVVAASIECGSVGYNSAELEAKVSRRLANGEQGAAELALWTGATAPGGLSLGIDNLQDAAVDITVADDSDFTAVIAALEDYLYRVAGYGNVGYIHAPVAMAAWAGDHHLIVDVGPLKKTPYGSIWIFGGGYPGTGAGGAEPPAGGAYLHISGQVTVWRSADAGFVWPVDQTLDRTTNQHHLLAEREYAIGFDCAAGRALFNPLGGS
jgi:hypothetical protein